MFRGVLPALAVCLALLAFAASAQAAPPANDNFANAIPISVGDEINSDNIEATAQAQDPKFFNACEEISESPQCASTVWYSFTAPSTGNFQVETCDMGTTFETQIGIYTGSLGSLVAVSQAQGGCENNPENGAVATLPATVGTTYHFAVNGLAARDGSYYLRLYAGPQKPRPTPDTGIDRYASFARAKETNGESSGALGVSRQSATFPLIASGPNVNFECSLDGAAFAPCTTPVSYDSLALGTSHVFEARAVEAGVPDPTPVVDRFTLDQTPPDTTILSGPASNSSSQEAEFSLVPTADLDGADSYLCGFDSTPTKLGCNQTETFEELCAGEHHFRAAAYDSASNLDPTPAEDHFVSTVGPVCAAPGGLGQSIIFQTATRLEVGAEYEDGGAGGTIRLEYGPTSAYGAVVEEPVYPESGKGLKDLEMTALTPSTVYHYKVSLETPFGTATTGDETASTDPLSGTLPGIQNDQPTAGEHAATIPFEIDPNGVKTSVALEVEANAPLPGESRYPSFESVPPVLGSGPQHRSFQIVDLEPGVTYHYRAHAYQEISPYNEVRGTEGTFTTTKGASISTTFNQHFVLAKKNVVVGRLGRGVRGLIFHLRNLPKDSAIFAKLSLGRLKATKRGKSSASGGARVILKLSKRFAAADLKTSKGKLPLLVTVRPPNDTASSVTVGVGLKPAPHKKHR